MKVAIVGYGQMGREVESVLERRGHTAVVRIDASPEAKADASELNASTRAGADVAIEFSLPTAVPANVARYAELGLPAVIGTTGWEASVPGVRSLVSESGIGLVAGSNFSVGAHIFFALVEHAAALVNSIEDYDILAYEIHHSRKKDSPSGTALTIAEKILAANHRKTRVQTETLHRQRDADELHFGSIRGGSVPGIHTVMIDSAADTVELRHTARNRGGFALGAVLAAEWIAGKHGYFTVEEFIQELLKEAE